MSLHIPRDMTFTSYARKCVFTFQSGWRVHTIRADLRKREYERVRVSWEYSLAQNLAGFFPGACDLHLSRQKLKYIRRRQTRPRVCISVPRSIAALARWAPFFLNGTPSKQMKRGWGNGRLPRTRVDYVIGKKCGEFFAMPRHANGNGEFFRQVN